MTHAKRLKTYHSPDDRPHYFLPEYQDVVLNPEELDDQNIEEIPPPNADQHQANADQPPADDENQLSHEDDAVEDNNDDDDHDYDQSIRNAAHNPQHQHPPPQPSTSEQNNQTKIQTKHKRNSKSEKPKDKKSKPFSTDQIERILEYSLYQGKPIYKIKFKGEPQTSWQDGNQIPKTLKDTFHSLYNAKGKKRKRPNKKYFDKQQPVQALSLLPKSQQEIYNASIDSRGTHIMFYLQNHDGSTTNGKYAYQVQSQLFKPFFRKLDQEINDSFKNQTFRKLSLISRRHFSIQNETL